MGNVSLDSIKRASLGAAHFDAYAYIILDRCRLKKVKELGLEQYLPKWVDFDTGRIQVDLFEIRVWSLLENDYLPAHVFREYQEREEEKGEVVMSPDSDKALNYFLVKQILNFSPKGIVSDSVYRASTARVLLELGEDVVRKIYERDQQSISDPRFRLYCGLRNEQIFDYFHHCQECLKTDEVMIQNSDVNALPSVNIFYCDLDKIC